MARTEAHRRAMRRKCRAGLPRPLPASGAAKQATAMIELPNPFADERGIIKLLEPADADREMLLAQVLCGTYGKPFVIEDERCRTLYFSLAYVQSSMRLTRPFDLELAYTRKMMGFLLFLPQPRSILMLGLGGGSLAKYCHRHLPSTRITVLEISPEVMAFREEFSIPPDDPRFAVILGDAAAYVAQCAEKPDVIMMDAFDRHGFSMSVCSRDFYRDVRAALSRRGLLVANLAGEPAERLAHLAMMREVFEDKVLVLPVSDDGNHIAFAFRDPAFEPRWHCIGDQARGMARRYGLDFEKLAGKLERSERLDYLERTQRRLEAA